MKWRRTRRPEVLDFERLNGGNPGMTRRLVLFFILLASLGLACVWQHLHAIKLRYRIADLQQKVQEKERVQRRKKVKIERLTSPERLRTFMERNQVELSRPESNRRVDLRRLRKHSRSRRRFAASHPSEE